MTLILRAIINLIIFDQNYSSGGFALFTLSSFSIDKLVGIRFLCRVIDFPADIEFFTAPSFLKVLQP
jgi:hypothetical protein